MISTASGKNDASSILKISSRCQFISQLISTRPTMPTPNTIQYQVGAGTRCGRGFGWGRRVSAVACRLACAPRLRPRRHGGGSLGVAAWAAPAGRRLPRAAPAARRFPRPASSSPATDRAPGLDQSGRIDRRDRCRRRGVHHGQQCCDRDRGQQRNEQLADDRALGQRRHAQGPQAGRPAHCGCARSRSATAVAAAPRRSLSANGGARCGFHLARTMT